MWNPDMNDILPEPPKPAYKHPAWRALRSIVEAVAVLGRGYAGTALKRCREYILGRLNASNSRGPRE